MSSSEFEIIVRYKNENDFKCLTRGDDEKKKKKKEKSGSGIETEFIPYNENVAYEFYDD